MSNRRLRELAIQHLEECWSPESIPRFLADHRAMTTLERNIERDLRRPPPVAHRSSGSPETDADSWGPVPSAGFHLYRLWAADGRLLYVGVSTHLSARLRVHRRRWGDLIERATWEEHTDVRAMLDAERRAITEEDPAFNRAAIG